MKHLAFFLQLLVLSPRLLPLKLSTYSKTRTIYRRHTNNGGAQFQKTKGMMNKHTGTSMFAVKVSMAIFSAFYTLIALTLNTPNGLLSEDR